jgi:large subunit ribosomal protein L22
MAAVQERRSVSAQAKWVRMSARKARVVAEHIRGRSVPEARTVLAFTPRAAAREIEKVLRSAVANAEANHGLIGDELYVERAVVDEGPTLKRWRARARGRVARIRKRTCHITLQLAPIPEDGAVPTTRARATPATTEERPRRAPRRRAVEAEAAVVEEAPAVEEEPVEAEEEPVEAEEKPKRARARKPKAEAPAEEPAEKPKRMRRRKTEEKES